MYLVTTEQFEVDGELFYEGVSWKDYTKQLQPQKSIKHGRLYDWDAFTDIRRIAPIGWHIPSVSEWGTLINYLGGYGAGGPLKEVGTLNWNEPNVGATNESNFTALPSGIKYGSDFMDIGNRCDFWAFESHYVTLIYNDSYIGTVYLYSKYGQSKSIRLIKDNSTNEGDVIIDGDTYHSVTIGNQVWLQQSLARTHYENGDLIVSAIAYNNDETNIYNTPELPSDDYVITYNGIKYIFPKDKVIETPRFTREQNIPFGEYQYRTHSDKTPDYFKRVEEYFGIDMKENYAAQFRDGKNPHKDINGSIFKENPDQ